MKQETRLIKLAAASTQLLNMLIRMSQHQVFVSLFVLDRIGW